MNKKMISIFMALIFVIGVFPMAYASASYGFNDYQQSVLEATNIMMAQISFSMLGYALWLPCLP